MAQNIKDVASSFRLPTGYVSGKTPAIYPPNKYLEDDVRMNPKRKYIYNGQPVITPKIPLSPVIRENKFDEHSRYLALFTQFSIIEDSFEFVHLTFHFDPFQCVYAGSFFEKIYGYSCKEIYENSGLFYEIAHPDDAGFLMEQIKRLIRNGYNEFSYRIIAKTGEVKYLKTNCWCQQDENFSLVISCYQKDITSQIETDRDTGKSNKKRHYISDIAVTLNSIDNFEEKLQSVVDKIGSVISNDQVNLYEIDDDLNHMVCRYIWVKQDTIIPPGVIVDVPPLSIMPDYINSFRFSLDEDVSGFMHYWNRQINVQSILVVPIRIKQRIFGFIELISTNHKRKLNDHDRGFIETIGNMVANFYDRKKISDELNLNHLKQELLANVSSRLNQYTDNKEHVMQSVLNYIGLKKPDTERIFIYRYCENRGVFLKTYEYVNSTFNVKYNSREEYDSMLFSEIITMLKAGKSYFVNDIAELKSTLQLVLQQLHVKSILLIPMFINGEFYGVYGYYIYSHYHIWRKNEIEIAQSFAGVISHSIERQEITKKLQDSENKFKNISEKLPGCVFQVTLSPAGEIRLNYISPQVEQWLGYKPTSKSSLEKIRQSIHPDDSEAFSRFAQEIKLLHTEVSFECRFFFSAKGFKWLIVKATLSEIRPLGECVYNGLLIDITENKQTELKLAEAGVSIQSIINNLGSGILLVDDRDNVLYINRPLLDMLA
ncbi:MAG: PAS domain-containing protein, partial [Prevotellaceae bacterium]|nr:PAS domain-containing protein [Prevotellaceae bacterium]